MIMASSNDHEDWATLAEVDDIELFDLQEENRERQEMFDRIMQQQMNIMTEGSARMAHDDEQVMSFGPLRKRLLVKVAEKMPSVQTITKHEAVRVDLAIRNRPVWPRGIWKKHVRPKKAVMDKLIAECPFDDQRQVVWILNHTLLKPKVAPTASVFVPKLEEQSGGLRGGEHPGFRQLSDDELKGLDSTYSMPEVSKFGVMPFETRCVNWGKYVAGELVVIGRSKLLVCSNCSKQLNDPDLKTLFGFHLGCHKVSSAESAKSLNDFLDSKIDPLASSCDDSTAPLSPHGVVASASLLVPPETLLAPQASYPARLTSFQPTSFPIAASVSYRDKKQRKQFEKELKLERKLKLRRISCLFSLACFMIHVARVVRRNLKYADSTNLTKQNAIDIFRTMNKIPSAIPINEGEITIQKRFMPDSSLPVNGVLRFVGIDKVDSVHYQVKVILKPNLLNRILMLVLTRWILFLSLSPILLFLTRLIPYERTFTERVELGVWDFLHNFIEPTVRENTLRMSYEIILGLRWGIFYFVRVVLISTIAFAVFKVLTSTYPAYYTFSYIPTICANLSSMYAIGADVKLVGSTLHQNIEKMGRFKWPVKNLKELMLGCEVVTAYMVQQVNFYQQGPMEILGITGCYTHWTLGQLTVKSLLKGIVWMKSLISWSYPSLKHITRLAILVPVEKVRGGQYTEGFGLVLLDIFLLLTLTHTILPLLWRASMRVYFEIFLFPLRFVWWLLKFLLNIG